MHKLRAAQRASVPSPKSNILRLQYAGEQIAKGGRRKLVHRLRAEQRASVPSPESNYYSPAAMRVSLCLQNAGALLLKEGGDSPSLKLRCDRRSVRAYLRALIINFISACSNAGALSLKKGGGQRRAVLLAVRCGAHLSNKPPSVERFTRCNDVGGALQICREY